MTLTSMVGHDGAPLPPVKRRRPTNGAYAVLLLSMIPLVWMGIGREGVSSTVAIALGFVLCTLSVAAMMLVTLRGDRSSARFVQLISLLSPTALLMAVFPLIVGLLNSWEIGQTNTLMVVLAVSVTVPWISSSITSPMYGPLGAVSRQETVPFFRHFCTVWPAMLSWSVLPILLFSGVVTLFLGWGLEENIFYVIGVAANVIFAQSLVPAQEVRRFGYVLAAWFCYALTLLIAPQLWFLAPLAGVVPQLFLIRRGLGGLRRPYRPETLSMLRQLGYGFLQGSVLWADKFFLIMLYRADVNIVMLYVSLIPVVIAQALYFGSQYDVLRKSMEGLQVMVDKFPCTQLQSGSMRLSRRVERSLETTVLIAVTGSLGLMFLAPLFGFDYTEELLMFICAPVAMLSLTMIAFQLSQLQRHVESGLICGAHLLVVGAALMLAPPAPAYLLIIVVDVIAIWWGVRRSRAAFVDSAYQLFWKEAVKW